jgi:hypothetical protein
LTQTVTSSPTTVTVPSTSTGVTVNTTDVGAAFPPTDVQLKNTSFAPDITSSQAITAAKNWVNYYFHFEVENLPADATVALFSGIISPTKTRAKSTATDVKIWVVVVKELPYYKTGPPPLPPTDTQRIPPLQVSQAQADVIVDATSGEVLYGSIDGKPIP